MSPEEIAEVVTYYATVSCLLFLGLCLTGAAL